MDTMGDADELGPDEIGVERPAGLLTPETCAIAGAGLVLVSLMSGGPLQIFQLDLYAPVDGRDAQLLWLIVPGALFALAGAMLGHRARRTATTPAMTGLGGAALVVGALLVAVYAFGYLRLVT